MSLTKVTYSMIEGGVANVKAFGATGDGVTDDTAAIQSALDNAQSVIFPEGTYLCKTEPIMQTAGQYIAGEGEVNIIQDTYGLSGIQVRAAGCTIQNIKFKNLKPKTMLSQNLVDRYEGDVARSRAAGVYLASGSNDFNLFDCYAYGFISGLYIKGGDELAWRTNIASTYTTTSFVLDPADQKPDGYWVGSVGRIMTVSGGSTSNFLVTGYTSSTNTITFATQGAISSSSFYYYLYKGFTKNVNVNNFIVDKIDFGIASKYGERLSFSELTAYEIEQTQQTNVRPHTIYNTSWSKDVSATNMRTYKCVAGQAYKFRGVTNLFIGDAFSVDSRGSFTIENCINASARNCSNFDSGKTSDAAPSIGDVTNSKNVVVENCSLVVSPDYNGGGLAALRPVGVQIFATGALAGFDGNDQIFCEQVSIKNITVTAGNTTDVHNGVLITGDTLEPLAVNKYIDIDGVTMYTNGLNATLSVLRNVVGEYVTARNLQVSGSGTPTVSIGIDSGSSDTLLLLDNDLIQPTINDSGTDTTVHYVADAEYGTWTPVVIGTTTAGTNTYVAQLGTYYKVGKTVVARCRVGLSGALSSTGSIQITGIPYPAAQMTGTASPLASVPFLTLASDFTNITLSSGDILTFDLNTNSSTIRFRVVNSTGVSGLLDTAFGSDASFQFNLTYTTQ
jgi:hypothetical protein